MKIRALEETDLQFVHHLNNEYTIMSLLVVADLRSVE